MPFIDYFKQFPGLHTTLFQGELLTVEGGPPSAMFILLRGTVNVIINNKVVSQIKEPGSYIGEISFILGCNYSANCVATGRTEVLRITSGEVFNVLKQNPQVALKLARQMAYRIKQVENKRLESICREESDWEHLRKKDQAREWLINGNSLKSQNNLIRLKKHELLISEGTASLYLYILNEGELQIKREGTEVCRIRDKGSYIGEISMLLGEHHIASCSATMPTSVIQIHKDRVANIFQHHPNFAQNFLVKITERLVKCNNNLAYAAS